MKNYINVENGKNLDLLKIAATSIQNGNLILMPTETVYGLGADGLNENAVKKIFEAKGRKQDNPLILHISDMKMLDTIACNISQLEKTLMEKFWPGPLTIILNRKKIVPDIVTGGLDTVGVRMPSNLVANKIIALSSTPIAAPSANISGRPSGTNIDDISDELSQKVETIVDDGMCDIGLESTVIRVVNNSVIILRPGKITKEDLEKYCDDVIVDKHILNKLDDNVKVLSPGMKYRHYAPNAKCILVYSDNNTKLIEKICEISKEYISPVIISTSENVNAYKNNTKVKNILDIGHRKNLDEISKNIFTYLRKVDTYLPDIVIIEGVKKEGLGLAIMNRLLRACEYNIIEV